MLTVSRRRPSWSLAWATWTSPWVSTPTVTRVGCACAMVVMAISLRLRAWGGWHAPAGWADSTAMGLWAQASDLLNAARTHRSAARSVQGAGRLARRLLAALWGWLADSVPGCGRHPP